MQQWEYTVVSEIALHRHLEKSNVLGQAGWEMVSCSWSSGSFTYVALFKRPLQADVPQGPGR